MNYINTDNAPKAIGPYSQAIEANGFVYTSGQIAINPETGNLEEGIEKQVHQVIKNLKNILLSVGLSLDNVIKTTVFVKDIKDFSIINDIYEKYFISKPARSLVEVSNLPKGALIEIEVIAVK